MTIPTLRSSYTTRQRLIRLVAVVQSLYALIEISDCITAGLMAVGLLENPYPSMLLPSMQELFDHQAVWLTPLFLFYTTLRVVSAWGLWTNRLWGFWLTIAGIAATVIMAPWLLPFTSLEILGNGILLVILLMAYFGDRPILARV